MFNSRLLARVRRSGFLKGLAAGTATGLVVSPFWPALPEEVFTLRLASRHLFNIVRAFARSYFIYVGEGELPERHRRAAAEFRRAFELNSGLFIKFGQIVALLEMLVPQEYSDEMSKLFQTAPRTEFAEVCRLIEKDLGRPVGEVFASIDPVPVGSASIAQVHRAVLLSGEEVAVKVQHPNLREALWIDMKMVAAAVRLLNRLTPAYDYDWIVRDMYEHLPQEMNFLIEAANCQRLVDLFAGDSMVRAPRIYHELCTERLVVMEFVRGYSIAEAARLRRDGVPLRGVAKHLSRAFNKMIFELGFVHGDPHPGNVFVESRGGGDYRLVLLDHGLYRKMSPETREAYSLLWTGIVTRDAALIRDACERLNVGDKFRLFTSIITAQDYNSVMDPAEGSLLRRIRGRLPADAQKQRNLRQAEKFRHQILLVLQEMNQEILTVLKINSYLDSIENRLGPKFYNLYNTAKYAFAHQLRVQRRRAHGLLARLRILCRALYFRCVLFVIRLYDWKQSLSAPAN